ncbi:MAG: LytTR family DNA-binding domain-containing protein [Bacteroidia bacterium]|nr:LytTR family DNA-binding domain-containing protein [Bacteroidia bacterium]
MDKRITVFIVDDEARAIETLSKSLLTYFPEVSLLGSANRIEEAYQKILETMPQLVFLDIEMGSENGFDLLEKFESIQFHVAFVTAHEEFALKAIKFSALDYIIKPASITDLKTLLLKLESKPKILEENLKVKQMFGNFLTEDKSEHKITVSIAEGYDFIKVSDILYLLADGSYTLFHLKNQQKITTSKGLKFFESILEGYGFFRIHNSTLINIKYIRRIGKSAGGSVFMEDGQELSISKGRKDEFLALLSIK